MRCAPSRGGSDTTHSIDRRVARKTNIVKDLFEALAAGATDFAAVKAAAVGCDLERPYVLVCAAPAGDGEAASEPWRSAAQKLGRDCSDWRLGRRLRTGRGLCEQCWP